MKKKEWKALARQADLRIVELQADVDTLGMSVNALNHKVTVRGNKIANLKLGLEKWKKLVDDLWPLTESKDNPERMFVFTNRLHELIRITENVLKEAE